MSRIATQSENFLFNVESSPSFMQLPDGSFVKDGFSVNRRTDTMQVLGKTGTSYGIVQNADLVNVAEEAFKAKGLGDFSRRVVVSGDGERFHGVYDFKNQVKKLSIGDEVGLRITMTNSFDGSLRSAFSLGTLRLTCSNGAVSLESEVSMARKHCAGITSTFTAQALDKALAAWDKSTEVFERLAGIQLTQQQGLNILGQLEETAVLSGKLREGIEGIWQSPRRNEDKGRNLFNLFNAGSEFLTHDVSKDRFELSQRITSNLLGVLDRAAKDSSRLAKLSQPVAVPAMATLLN